VLHYQIHLIEHFHILMNTKMEHLEVKHGTNFAKKQTLIKLQEKQKQVKIFSVLYRKNLQSLLLWFINYQRNIQHNFLLKKMQNFTEIAKKLWRNFIQCFLQRKMNVTLLFIVTKVWFMQIQKKMRMNMNIKFMFPKMKMKITVGT